MIEQKGLDLTIRAMKCHKGLARLQLIGGECAENASQMIMRASISNVWIVIPALRDLHPMIVVLILIAHETCQRRSARF